MQLGLGARPCDQLSVSWGDVLKVRRDHSNSAQLQVLLRVTYEYPADRLWKLRRDYERLELPSQLDVPYDLLEAANPDGLDDLRAGKTISLGAVWQVEGCETVFTVAQELSAIANKTIHPYEVIKYNIEVNPARLRPGTILVVPLARDKAISSAVKAE